MKTLMFLTFVFLLTFGPLESNDAESIEYIDSQYGVMVDQLLSQAIEHNPEVLAVKQRIAEMRGLLVQASLHPNPSIEADISDGSVLNNPGERAVSIGYTHPIELGNKRKRRIEVAQLELQQAEFEFANRQRELKADVESAFAAALTAARNLQATDDLLLLNEKNFSIIQIQVETGESARLDQGLLEVEINRIKADRLLFKSELDRSILDLKTLAGMDPRERLRIKGKFDLTPAKLTQDDALKIAFEQRPDLKAAQAEYQAAQSEINLAKAEGISDLETSIIYSREKSSFDQFGFDEAGQRVPITETDNTLTAGILIPLPFLNRNQGNIQAASARSHSAQLKLQAIQQTVRKEVLQAYGRYQAAAEALQLYDQNIMRQSQENLQITRASYGLGELRLLDVINEQRHFIDTQKAYGEALKEYYLSAIELEKSIGSSNPVKE